MTFSHRGVNVCPICKAFLSHHTYPFQSHCAKLAQSCIPVGYHGVSLSHKSAGPLVPAVPNGTMPILVVITMSTAPSFGSAVFSVTKRHARVGLNSYQRVPFHDQTWTPMRENIFWQKSLLIAGLTCP